MAVTVAPYDRPSGDPDVLESTDNNKDYHRAHSALKFLLQMMSACGLSSYRKTGWAKCGSVMCSVAGFTLVWLNALRFLPSFSDEDTLGPEFFLKVCTFVNGLANAAVYTCMLVTSKHAYGFVQRWTSDAFHVAVKDYARALSWLVRGWVVLVVVTFVGSVGGVVGAYGAGRLDAAMLGLIIYPLGTLGLSPTEEVVALIICQVLMTWIVCVLMVLFGVNLAFTYVAARHFRHVTHHVTALVASINQSERSTQAGAATRDDSMATWRQRHDEACELVGCLDDFISAAIGLAFAAGIAILCLLLYNATQVHDMEDGGTVTIIYGILAYTLLLLAQLAIGSHLTSAAHAPVRSLYKVDLGRLSAQEYRQVRMFVERLNGPTIGVTAARLFVVDTHAILMVGGTVVTYTIVVFQFPGTAGECKCVWPNVTNHCIS